MSRKRVSSSKGQGSQLKKKVFLGLSISGGKTDKTCFSVIEYFPDQNKIFLSQLVDKIKTDKETSSDLKLHQLILPYEKSATSLSMNVPLTWPKCIRCRLKCPGYEACKEKEIQWMWKKFRKNIKKNKLKKLFTPYTERCVEQYLASEIEEVFHLPHALGANVAPLTARAFFIKKRLKLKFLEVYPKLNLWRIGRALGIQKSYLRAHKHAVSGLDARKAILDNLVDMDVAFIYVQDFQTMVRDSHAFDAFICALTGVLKYRNQCEKKPKDFPSSEGWIEIPKMEINW